MKPKRPAVVLPVLFAVALGAVGASSCSSPKADVTVQMVNFTYKPSVDVVINAGQTVGLMNATSTLHNITLLHGVSFSLDAPPGTTVITDKLGKLKPGTYFFRCRYHYLQGMVGVLTVQASGGSS